MEFSERCIATLEKEGFSSISEEVAAFAEKDGLSQTSTSLVVTDGSLTVLYGGISHSVHVGDRLDIPAAAPYSLTAGPNGYH
jgi:hypothetical protein